MRTDSGKRHSDKYKREFEKKVTELRKRISIAKAELERIRENRKITKKGRKNRTILMEECKKISSSELINYMEKKKSQLRKLKAGYTRGKKLHEARSINREFNQDTRKVYAQLSGRCAVKTRSDLNIRVPLAIALGVIVKKDLRTLRMQAISG